MSAREEYTPSMDRVRHLYARTIRPDGTVELASRRQKEFDRWLAAHDRALREQIVRLIAPTDVEIEAAAESLYPGLFTLSDFRYEIEFDNLAKDRPYHQEAAKDEARAALRAAREARA